MIVTVRSVEEISKAVKAILAFSKGRKVFAFHAPMGAGKTTLIKELCKQLGSTDAFSSPTFSIINEYRIADSREKIFHLDLYRLRSLEEAVQAGVEDCLSGEHYCFIEWPELMAPILPDEAVQLSMTVHEDGARQITIFDSDSKS